MLNVKSKGSSKKLVKDIDLTPVTRTITGSYVDLHVITMGRICWLRASAYFKASIPANTETRINNINGIKPLYSIMRRYLNLDGTYISLSIKQNGDITVSSPKALNADEASLNISEMFILQSGGGFLNLLTKLRTFFFRKEVTYA